MTKRKNITQQRHEDEASRVPYPESGHTGFWLNVDDEAVHVLGDINMSRETADAIAEVARLVRYGEKRPAHGWYGWPGPYRHIVDSFEAKLNLIEVRYGD